MTTKLTTVISAALLAFLAAPEAFAQKVIANFEGNLAVAQDFTSHKATTTLVDDTPKGKGEAASKTAVEAKAGTRNFFGTGYPTPAVNLSSAKAITFWLKTDIESDFNLQIHSEGKNALVFRISTMGSQDRYA